MDTNRPPHHNTLIIATIATLIILASGMLVYFYLEHSQSSDVLVVPSPIVGNEGNQVQQEDTTAFPASSSTVELSIPETNPFKTATNPFEDSYKNPFQ